MVDDPTCKKNILDVFLTSVPLRITKTTVASGLGDHEAVRSNILLRLNRKKLAKRLIRLWKNVDLGFIKKDVRAFATIFLASHKISDPVDQFLEPHTRNLQSGNSFPATRPTYSEYASVFTLLPWAPKSSQAHLNARQSHLPQFILSVH